MGVLRKGKEEEGWGVRLSILERKLLTKYGWAIQQALVVKVVTGQKKLDQRD